MGFTRIRPNFIIPVSDTQAYKQFGNSIVVPLVKEIAEHMVEAMESTKKEPCNAVAIS